MHPAHTGPAPRGAGFILQQEIATLIAVVVLRSTLTTIYSTQHRPLIENAKS